MVLLSQLYALVDDNTEVDTAVDKLRLAGAYRMVAVGGAGSEYALVDSRGYNALLTQAAEGAAEATDRGAFEAFRDTVLQEHRGVNIPTITLTRALGEGIKPLVQAGFLLLQGGDDGYRIAVPRLGSFVQMLRGGSPPAALDTSALK